MSNDGRLRFDANALDLHAEEYCKKELQLTRELVETLRVAASCAPVEYASRARGIMNDADQLRNYFSKMNEALVESGQLVEATSRAVLERLEEADEKVKALLV
jgi:hypothetical protein